MTDFNAPRLIGCTCSEMQLNLVGCDCAADRHPVMEVSIWLDGYASESGQKTVQMSAIADFRTEAKRLFGNRAEINYKRELKAPVKSVSAETARYYTQGDNT